MGNFKKPKRKLKEFLKDTKSVHNRKGLLKLGFGLASGAVAFNVLLSGTVFGHTNIPPVNTAHTNITSLGQEAVAGTKCWKLVGQHASTPHVNTPHNSVY